jgi:hypothetical protein
MWVRWILLGLLAITTTAQNPSADQDRALKQMIGALADSDAGAFLRYIDKGCACYDDLRTRVVPLLEHFLVESRVTRLDDGKLQWTIKIRRDMNSALLVERSEEVVIQWQRRGKQWRVTEFSGSRLFEVPEN